LTKLEECKVPISELVKLIDIMLSGLEELSAMLRKERREFVIMGEK